MAFNNSITARYDELRSPNPPASSTSTGTTTPSRYSGSFMQSHSQSYNDARASLQRRQTTDLGKMPLSITPIGQGPITQTSKAPEPVEMAATVSNRCSMTYHKVILSFYCLSLISLSLFSQLLCECASICSGLLTGSPSITDLP